jgi:hypothetical protein
LRRVSLVSQFPYITGNKPARASSRSGIGVGEALDNIVLQRNPRYRRILSQPPIRIVVLLKRNPAYVTWDKSCSAGSGGGVCIRPAFDDVIGSKILVPGHSFILC